MRKLIYTSILILLAIPLSAMERDSWKGSISPSASVRVDNPWGDIRLRHGGEGSELEVAVVFQQLATDESILVLDTSQVDDTFLVSILRHDNRGSVLEGKPGTTQPRADVAILVPEGFPTRAETDSGLIEAQGVHCDIDLHTTEGMVRALKVVGAINVTNDRGPTSVNLSDGVTDKAQRFSSITGPITVFTSSAADLTVTMATSGRFTTDFTLVVDHNDAEEPSKKARAEVGDGGASLDLTSKRGDLALLRLVTPDTD